MFRIRCLLFGQCCANRAYSSQKIIEFEACIIIYRVYIVPTDFRMSSGNGRTRRAPARFDEASSIVGDRSGRGTGDLVTILRRASSAVSENQPARLQQSLQPWPHPLCFLPSRPRMPYLRLVARPSFRFVLALLPRHLGVRLRLRHFDFGPSAFDFGRPISATCATTRSLPGR